MDILPLTDHETKTHSYILALFHNKQLISNGVYLILHWRDSTLSCFNTVSIIMFKYNLSCTNLNVIRSCIHYQNELIETYMYLKAHKNASCSISVQHDIF